MKRNPFGTKPEKEENVLPETEVTAKNSFIPSLPVAQVPEADVNFIQAVEKIKTILPEGVQFQLVPKGAKGIIVKKEFNLDIKNKIEELTSELQTIGGISSQDDAVKANVSLKKAKTLIKTLSAERLLMTSVLDEEKADTMSYEKAITENLQNLVNVINNNITIFQTAELEKAKKAQEAIDKKKREELAAAQAETDRIAKIKNLMLEFEKNVLNAIHSSTVKTVDERITQLNTFDFNEKVYQEFLPEAQILLQSLKAKFQERKVELMKLAEAEKTNKEAAEKMRIEQEEKARIEKENQTAKAELVQQETQDQLQESVSNIQMESEFKGAMVPKAKGISLPWVFDEETIDMALLPIEFHTFDKKKIKEAISAGLHEIPGVKIYQKVTNVSR